MRPIGVRLSHVVCGFNVRLITEDRTFVAGVTDLEFGVVCQDGLR